MVRQLVPSHPRLVLELVLLALVTGGKYLVVPYPVVLAASLLVGTFYREQYKVQ